MLDHAESTRAGEPAPLTPIPGSDPEPVRDADAYPYCCVGLVTMRFPDATAIGTATVISLDGTGGGRFLLTCAHNLYDEDDGGDATEVRFEQARNGSGRPSHPAVAVTDWRIPPGYRDVALSRAARAAGVGRTLREESGSLDFALARLERPAAAPAYPSPTVIGAIKGIPVDLVGLYGWNEGDDDEMYRADGPVDTVSDGGDIIGYPISTRVGASGTGVFADDHRAIAGVHIHGGSNGDRYNYARRVTEPMLTQLARWAAEMT
ncbi:trypsin-like serine peptidase [Agromyces sp. SYSU T00266]|uniref:trypsin-like serine peptidase n=1 Tax=Agromyces zhanjiangensis TaxID=3158562 RepID=UPI0033942B0B